MLKTLAFSVSDENPDRLFKEGTPTYYCVFVALVVKVLLFCVLVSAGIYGTLLAFGYLGVYSTGYGTSCPYYGAPCTSMKTSYGGCIFVWTLGCALIGVPTLLVILLILGFISLLYYVYNEARMVYRLDNPEALWLILEHDDDDLDEIRAQVSEDYLVWWKTDTTALAVKAHLSYLILIVSVTVVGVLGLFLVRILFSIAAFIGVLVTASGITNDWCVNRTSLLGNISRGCITIECVDFCPAAGATFLLATVIGGLLVYKLFACLCQFKTALKAPEDIEPIKTKYAVERTYGAL